MKCMSSAQCFFSESKLLTSQKISVAFSCTSEAVLEAHSLFFEISHFVMELNSRRA